MIPFVAKQRFKGYTKLETGTALLDPSFLQLFIVFYNTGPWVSVAHFSLNMGHLLFVQMNK